MSYVISEALRRPKNFETGGHEVLIAGIQDCVCRALNNVTLIPEAFKGGEYAKGCRTARIQEPAKAKGHVMFDVGPDCDTVSDDRRELGV